MMADVYVDDTCGTALSLRTGVAASVALEHCSGVVVGASKFSYKAECDEYGGITYTVCTDIDCSVGCSTIRATDPTCLPISELPNLGVLIGQSDHYAARGRSAYLYCYPSHAQSSHTINAFNSTLVIGMVMLVIGVLALLLVPLAVYIQRRKARSSSSDHVRLQEVAESGGEGDGAGVGHH
jgi:hypothetical protein